MTQLATKPTLNRCQKVKRADRLDLTTEVPYIQSNLTCYIAEGMNSLKDKEVDILRQRI